MKKIENFDHLRLEKALTTSDKNEKLDLNANVKGLQDQIMEVKDQLDQTTKNQTTEEHQALEAIVQKAMTRMESQMEQLEQKVVSYLDESKEREQLMLKGQKKSESMLKKLGENPAFLAGCGVILGDWANDLVKEVVKKMVSEERFEACSFAIKAFLQSFSNPVFDLISQLSPELKIATAVVTLLAARFFLNHTATVSQPIRSGLAKLKSMFASKK